ncbi:MAG: 30S ribosomal protein S3 [Candidatus Diapherotrites archaeon]|nr:30S ribosomal protein S3 [Candidatus Diapherotrites archaeon]
MIKQKFVSEGILNAKLKEFVKTKYSRANVINVSLEETGIVSRVIIEAERPGLVIGKSGESIQRLTVDLKEQFGIESPQIEVKPLEKSAEMNGEIVAKRITQQMVKRPKWRPIVMRALERVMANGAQGVEITVKGALIGKGAKAMKTIEKRGYMKKSGNMTSMVSIGKSTALLKKGAIGVTVRIIPPDALFPDKVPIKELLKDKIAELHGVTEEAPEGKTEIIKVEEEKKEETKPAKKEKKPKAEKKPAAKKTTKKKAEKKEVKETSEQVTEEKKPKKEEVKEEKKAAEEKKDDIKTE